MLQLTCFNRRGFSPGPSACILLLLVLALALQQQFAAAKVDAADAADILAALDGLDGGPARCTCCSEEQVIYCGQIPLTPRFKADRIACCRAHRPTPENPEAKAEATAAAAQQTSVVSSITRSDLTVAGYLFKSDFTYPYGSCGIPTEKGKAAVPTFIRSDDGSGYILVDYFPPKLSKTVIQSIKAAAIAALPADTRKAYSSLKVVTASGGFNHPGSAVGPGELAVMKTRLASGSQVQVAAKNTLISGEGVVPKSRTTANGTVWSPPTNCPASG